ncbi:CBS domain-containing protein [Reichenbachiella versicolor]|uniref:CBS domain-containing protein n=1 Tax=Reichenbachiella versicolor TaxID=1821036 RepID=UPI000D6E831B|nr:CBS domain-containing protein [Reichenbachiella versicolor]
MDNQDTIASIMTKELVTCDINDSLQKVSNLFAEYHIRHMPITSEGKLIGIVSKTDIMRISFGNIYGEDQIDADHAILDMLSINQVMKHSPVSVEAHQLISDASRIFTEHEFHALPVIQNDQLAGIVTTTDVISYYAQKESTLV